MKKVIVGLSAPFNVDKSDDLCKRVAAHLGLTPADVLVMPPGTTVAVVDVADAKPPVDAVTPPSLPAWTAKSKPKE